MTRVVPITVMTLRLTTRVRLRPTTLRHNTDVRRLKGVSEKDIARMEKYHRFYLELTFHLKELDK